MDPDRHPGDFHRYVIAAANINTLSDGDNYAETIGLVRLAHRCQELTGLVDCFHEVRQKPLL
jgi:hypothetical protein